MCLMIAIAALILIFYGSERLQEAIFAIQSSGNEVVLARDWGILTELWPFLAAAFLFGVIFVLILLKFIPKSTTES